MSTRLLPPAVFIPLIILLAFPQIARSQCAIGQLEAMTGQQIRRLNQERR